MYAYNTFYSMVGFSLCRLDDAKTRIMNAINLLRSRFLEFFDDEEVTVVEVLANFLTAEDILSI